jgi:hypothetical protein
MIRIIAMIASTLTLSIVGSTMIVRTTWQLRPPDGPKANLKAEEARGQGARREHQGRRQGCPGGCEGHQLTAEPDSHEGAASHRRGAATGLGTS